MAKATAKKSARAEQPREIVIAQLSEVRGPEQNPRTKKDEEKLAELAASIKLNGQQQPVFALLLTGPNRKGYKYEIVAGERRYLALQRIESEMIQLIVVGEKGKVTLLEILKAQLTENANREDMTIMDMARAAGRLQEEFGQSVEAIATTLGKSTATIYNYLKLLTLHEDLQAAVELPPDHPDYLPLTIAVLVLKVKAEKQCAAWKEIKRRGKTVPVAQDVMDRRLERIADRALGTKTRVVRKSDRWATIMTRLTAAGEGISSLSVLDLTDVLVTRSTEDLAELRTLLGTITDQVSVLRGQIPRRN